LLASGGFGAAIFVPCAAARRRTSRRIAQALFLKAVLAAHILGFGMTPLLDYGTAAAHPRRRPS